MEILIAIFALVFGAGLFKDFTSKEGCERAVSRSIFWTVLAFLYGLSILIVLGPDKASEYWICLTLEKMLSLDNLFVFSIIFSVFKLSEKEVKKALSYGIVGAIIFRCIFLFMGVTAIKSFSWLLPIFGVVLIFTGLSLLKGKDDAGFKSLDFIGRLGLNTFWTAVVLVEFNDIMFAIDSVPAVLNVSQDMFIVATSNIAAIQCLRSYYQVYEKFKVNAVQASFNMQPVERSLAVILILIGFKNLVPVHLSILMWFATIIAILGVGIVLGFRRSR